MAAQSSCFAIRTAPHRLAVRGGKRAISKGLEINSFHGAQSCDCHGVSALGAIFGGRFDLDQLVGVREPLAVAAHPFNPSSTGKYDGQISHYRCVEAEQPCRLACRSRGQRVRLRWTVKDHGLMEEPFVTICCEMLRTGDDPRTESRCRHLRDELVQLGRQRRRRIYGQVAESLSANIGRGLPV